MRLLLVLVVALAGPSRLVVAQAPPPLFGFRLGELRAPRHRVLPCSTLTDQLQMCQVSDTSSITFLGDTLVDVTYVKPLGLTAQSSATIWLETMRPWATLLLGNPDSVRNRDSTIANPEGQEMHSRNTTAYWTGAPGRRWSAVLFVVKVGGQDALGTAHAGLLLKCAWQLGQSQAQCPRRN